jgi:hypothetical protein
VNSIKLKLLVQLVDILAAYVTGFTYLLTLGATDVLETNSGTTINV